MKMQRTIMGVAVCAAALSFAVGALAGDGNGAIEAAPTVVPLVKSADNAVQLGLMVKGEFAYPFTFATSPAKLDNNLSVSATGLVTGKPDNAGDQNVTVTVTDSTGKTVASYPVVLRVGSPPTVMMGMVAAPAAMPVPTGEAGAGGVKPAAKAAAPTFVLETMYGGGDTVIGQLLPKAKASDTAQAGAAKAGGAAGGGGGGAGAGGAGGAGAGDPPPAAVTNEPANTKATFDADTFTVKCTPRTPVDNRPIPGCDPESTATVISAADGSLSYQFNRPVYPGDVITVTSSSGEPHSILVQRPPRLYGEEMRSIVGYQQAGGSSSGFTQNWFLDFYISRPLALRRDHEGGMMPWRWWGNVRVASFPQAGNQTLAEVATGLPAQVGSLKLNELAQGAEFLSGLEIPLFGGQSFPFRGKSENTRQVFSLGLIAGFGATGFFSAPSNNVQVFAVPAAGSPQLATFQQAFPGVNTANVGFISPDTQRFPKQYLAGLRLTTHYIKPTGLPLTSAPAMLAFTVGQNQVITNGHLSGVVGRVEAFYPMPFGERLPTMAGAFSSLYLFGTVQMKLGKNVTAPALALSPVTTPASDPTVTLVPLPNARDEYRIGFGVDLVSLIHSLTTAAQKPAQATTSSAGAGKTPTSSSTATPSSTSAPNQ